MCPLGSANGAYVLPFLVCAELIAKRENAKRLLLFPEDRSTARGGCWGQADAIGNYFVCHCSRYTLC